MRSAFRGLPLWIFLLLSPIMTIAQTLTISFSERSSDETPASLLSADVSISYSQASGILTITLTNKTTPQNPYTISALYLNTLDDVGFLLLHSIPSLGSAQLLADRKAGPFGLFDWKIDLGQGNAGILAGQSITFTLTVLGTDVDLADFFSELSSQPGAGSSDRRARGVIFFTRGPSNDSAFGTSKGGVVGPAGGTIVGPDGSSVTIQPGSIPYEAVVDINPVDLSDVVAPLGELEAVGAVDVTFKPAVLGGTPLPPSSPLQVAIPALASLTNSHFVVGQQILVDSLDPSPHVSQQLLAVDTASLTDGNIVTEVSILPGISGGGLFVFVANTGSGFAMGTVSDSSGPRPGVVVSNSTNTLVSVTNGSGQYALFINGGPFTVTGFDPFRGSIGATASQISTPGSIVQGVNIFLTPLATPPITRDGIRNGGFERNDLTSWATTGTVIVRPHLGPTSTGVIIQPTEGQWMADINTGPGAVGGVGSSLEQRFIVPAGVKTLRLNFNFVSEEFPEFVGTIFNDAFRAIITTPDGESTFAQVSVNDSGGFTLIGDCFFPGGDFTCGQTGWREGSVDLSAYAGATTPITVELLFTAIDAGDNIYDTHVLVDNIRFSTLWIDAKIIQGADRDVVRVHQEVQQANEILSQAGLNVRIRDAQTIGDPGGLLDTDITWDVECRPPSSSNCKGVPTPEEIDLMGLARSATATDVNVYYVHLMTENGAPGGAAALAVGPDDFHDVDILVNAGTILQDVMGVCVAGGHVLAHELGHLLISPQRPDDALEHSAGSANFMGGSCATPLLGMLTREQSANISRVAAPLLVP